MNPFRHPPRRRFSARRRGDRDPVHLQREKTAPCRLAFVTDVHARRPPVARARARALDNQLLTAVARGYLDHLQILAVPEHVHPLGTLRGEGRDVLVGSVRFHARGIDARPLIDDAVSRGSDRRADVATRVLRSHAASTAHASSSPGGADLERGARPDFNTFTCQPEIISRGDADERPASSTARYLRLLITIVFT